MTLPTEERERAKRLLHQAVKLAGIVKRLMLTDPADSPESAACDILTSMQTSVMEMQISGILGWTDALDLSETILKVFERIITRREAMIRKSQTQ